MLVKYCYSCRARLTDMGFPAIEVYDAICMHTVTHKKPFFFDLQENSNSTKRILSLLENKGFIVTHEHEDILLVRPSGSQFEHENTHWFCSCKNDFENEIGNKKDFDDLTI